LSCFWGPRVRKNDPVLTDFLEKGTFGVRKGHFWGSRKGVRKGRIRANFVFSQTVGLGWSHARIKGKVLVRYAATGNPITLIIRVPKRGRNLGHFHVSVEKRRFCENQEFLAFFELGVIRKLGLFQKVTYFANFLTQNGVVQFLGPQNLLFPGFR
jgi:hypothetical protein